MGVVCHHQLIMMDASLSGWGAVFKGRPVCGVWTGKYLVWHINSLEMRAVNMVLVHFLLFLAHSHVIIRTDNMAVVLYIDCQRDSRSHTLDKHMQQLLLWAQEKNVIPETGPCPRGREHSGRLSVKTVTQIRGMDAEPSDGGSDL